MTIFVFFILFLFLMTFHVLKLKEIVNSTLKANSSSLYEAVENQIMLHIRNVILLH